MDQLKVITWDLCLCDSCHLHHQHRPQNRLRVMMTIPHKIGSDQLLLNRTLFEQKRKNGDSQIVATIQGVKS